MSKSLNSFVLAFALALIVLTGSVGSGQVQPDALVAHYTFDETSGTTAANTATPAAPGLAAPDAVQDSGSITWTGGIIGGAGDFNGNSDLLIGDLFSGSTPTAFTVAGWVNPDAVGGFVGVFASRASNFGLNAVNPGNLGGLFDYRYDNINGTSSQGLRSDAGSAVNGEWHHLALTWQTDGTVGSGEYFLNGASLGNTVAPPTALYGDQGVPNWYVGSDDRRNIDAQLDDFAAWNVALTATEVNTLYNDGLMNTNAAGVFGGTPGDVDLDGDVDAVDYQIINGNMFNPAFGPATAGLTPAMRTDGDLNGDGLVTYVDFTEWKSLAPPAALASVPEPSSAALLLSCFALVVGGMRRR